MTMMLAPELHVGPTVDRGSAAVMSHSRRAGVHTGRQSLRPSQVAAPTSFQVVDDGGLGASPQGSAPAPQIADSGIPGASGAPGQQAGTTPGKVTAVSVITGPAGAVTGFPAIPGVPDLNSPGPVNNVTTGACTTVIQVRFDLTGIPPREVDLVRKKDGVAGPVGSETPRTGLDGPSEPTKLRQASLIAVADPPGIKDAGAKAFPLRYSVDFQVFAFDLVTKAIMAKSTYSVNIVKQSQADPNPVNEVKNIHTTTF